ncbi:MAG: DUF2232 domain-containing protein [Deltaproteobacteria bacterium]|nr:DUF2232 domain-containing protein [Deltaproteobacteria bacterium]
MGAEKPLSARSLGLGIAATTALFLVAVVVPLFGFVLGLLTMVPAVYLSRRGDSHWTALQIVPAAALLLLLAFRSFGPMLGYLVEYGLPTVAVALAARKKPGPLAVLVRAAAASSLVVVLAIFFYALQASQSPMALIQQVFQANLELVRQVYEQMGVPADQLAVLTDSAQVLARWVGLLFPALIFASYFFLIGLTMAVVTLWGRYRQTVIDWGPGRPFTAFAVPPGAVWVLIACWTAVLLVPGLPPAAAMVLDNTIFILVLFYFLQGMAIIHYYLDGFRVGFVGRFFIFFLLFAFLFLLVAVAVVGLFDLWVDFRRFGPRPAADE